MRAKTTSAQELIYHKIKAIQAGFDAFFLAKSLIYIEQIMSFLDGAPVGQGGRVASNRLLRLHFK